MRILADQQDLQTQIEKLMASGRGYACFPSAHLMTEAAGNGLIQDALLNAAFIGLDGQPVAWIARHKYHLSVQRVPGPDAMDLILRFLSERGGGRIGLFGSQVSVLADLSRIVVGKYHGIQVVGLLDPGKVEAGQESEPDMIDVINSWNADIVFVSLGAPKQELWMYLHSRLIDCPLLGVGAAFGFMAGRERRAPRFVGRLGFEWMWRFVQNPVRMGPRYLQSLRWILAESFSPQKQNKILRSSSLPLPDTSDHAPYL